MCLAISCPWAGPNCSVLSISMSSVPWSSSIRSEDLFGIMLVDILPSNTVLRVDVQPSVSLGSRIRQLSAPANIVLWRLRLLALDVAFTGEGKLALNATGYGSKNL